MRRALELAVRGRGKTSPNPMVGAVIVKNGRVVGEGYHRRAGADHAEVVALREAGRRARGACMYVTLEPCCHTGNTGPCTIALIDHRIERVVYAVRDPDPRVRGRGARELRRAGVTVEHGVLGKDAARLNEQYFGFHQNRRPFIILKAAQTLDGRIATATGDSRWISGRPARVFAHRLRSEVDGVVVGMGTVKTDNPALTVRLVKGRNPYRIVLSRSLDFPRTCELLDDNEDFKTVVASTEAAIERFVRRRRNSGITFWVIKSDRQRLLDLNDFVAKAARFGIRSLLVEGGSRLATSFVKAGLVDKLVVVTAPMLIGEGRSLVGDLKIRKLSRAIELTDSSFERCGNDVIVTGYPKRRR